MISVAHAKMTYPASFIVGLHIRRPAMIAMIGMMAISMRDGLIWIATGLRAYSPEEIS